MTLGKVALALLPVSRVLGGAPGSRPMSVRPSGLLDSSSPMWRSAVELPAPRPPPAGGGPARPTAGTTFPGVLRGRICTRHRQPSTPTSDANVDTRRRAVTRPTGFDLAAQPAPLPTLGAAGSLPASTQTAEVTVSGQDAPEPLLAGSSRPWPVHTLGSSVTKVAALAFAKCVKPAQTGPRHRGGTALAAAAASWRPFCPRGGRLATFACLQS